MRVVVRADASTAMGSGHVMRCLTLAGELARSGAHVEFISSTKPGNLNGLIAGAHGFITHSLPEGVDSRLDAELSREFVGRGARPDWLIVDHYSLGGEWEQALRPHVDRLLVIDDLSAAPHYCDALLNQNLQEDDGAYEGLLPEECLTLLGPRYALLRPEFREARGAIGERQPKIERLLVSFGGTDPTGETIKVLEQVSSSRYAVQLHLDCVVGQGYGALKQAARLVEALPGAVLHVQTQEIARLMAEADICIGAGGATIWERCCLGLPTLTVAVAQHQEPYCELLDRLGYCIYLGSSTSEDIDYIGALDAALLRPEALADMSRRGMELVDGRGAARVASHIMEVR